MHVYMHILLLANDFLPCLLICCPIRTTCSGLAYLSMCHVAVLAIDSISSTTVLSVFAQSPLSHRAWHCETHISRTTASLGFIPTLNPRPFKLIASSPLSFCLLKPLLIKSGGCNALMHCMHLAGSVPHMMPDHQSFWQTQTCPHINSISPSTPPGK